MYNCNVFSAYKVYRALLPHDYFSLESHPSILAEASQYNHPSLLLDAGLVARAGGHVQGLKDYGGGLPQYSGLGRGSNTKKGSKYHHTGAFPTMGGLLPRPL